MGGETILDATGGFAPSARGLWLPERVAPARRPTAVDLFAGAGGFTLGMIQGGFEVLAGVDNDPWSMLTYLYNLGASPCEIHYVTADDEDRAEKVGRSQARAEARRAGAAPGASYDFRSSRNPARPELPRVGHFWLGDVRQIKGDDILDALGLEVGELDCVCGGPPCQGFSVSGRRNVMDPRNSLVFEFARLVLEMRPKTMVFENVPGILSMVTPEGLPVVDELCRVLQDGGFGTVDALKRSLLATAGAGAALRGGPVEKSRKRRLGEPVQVGIFEEVAP
jgi:DNA (cytosine-5)-methyltransferase 1